MVTPPYLLPHNEQTRLQAIHSFEADAALKEPILQPIIDLTAHTFNLPISFISLVAAEQVDFIATHGITELGTLPRAQALCSMPVRQGVTVVLNKLLAASASVHQQTAATLGLDFYVGVPLLLEGDLAFGALCVSDKEPRQFSADEQQVLEQLAALISQVVVVRHAYLQQEAGGEHWQQVQQKAMEELLELEALVCYIKKRNGSITPAPISLLVAVSNRVRDVMATLSGEEVGQPI